MKNETPKISTDAEIRKSYSLYVSQFVNSGLPRGCVIDYKDFKKLFK